MTVLFFTYGSLKRGFPNHEEHSGILDDFLGVATTIESMPLIVPYEPSCTNPNCQWLHRMPTLLDIPGKGEPVEGEVFRMAMENIKELDKLEGFISPGNPENVYERRQISVKLQDAVVEAEAYVIADPGPKMDEWKRGEAEAVGNYTLEMAATRTRKPNYSPPG